MFVFILKSINNIGKVMIKQSTFFFHPYNKINLQNKKGNWKLINQTCNFGNIILKEKKIKSNYNQCELIPTFPLLSLKFHVLKALVIGVAVWFVTGVSVLCQVGMSQGLGGCHAPFTVQLQHLLQQIYRYNVNNNISRAYN